MNYRSGRAIVEFNNAFFSHVSATHAALPLVQDLFDADFRQTDGPDLTQPPLPCASPLAPSPKERGTSLNLV